MCFNTLFWIIFHIPQSCRIQTVPVPTKVYVDSKKIKHILMYVCYTEIQLNKHTPLGRYIDLIRNNVDEMSCFSALVFIPHILVWARHVFRPDVLNWQTFNAVVCLLTLYNYGWLMFKAKLYFFSTVSCYIRLDCDDICFVLNHDA